ncbi:MAG: hypothetical protein IIX80_04365 [Clostridia bacterium]|nr:hypothetical protein [Clostridia bacterium]
MRNLRSLSRRLLFCLLLILLLTPLLCLPIAAEAKEEEENVGEKIPEEFTGLLDSLPEELAKLLPDGIFSLQGDAVAGAVAEMGSFSYLLETVLVLCGVRLRDCVGLFALLCGILVLSALSRTVQGSFSSGGIGKSFSFCSSLVIFLSLLTVGYRNIASVTSYLSNLNAMTASCLPLLGALYALGGNVSTAVASSAGLSIFMTLLEEAVGKTVLPFCGICLAFSSITALEPELRLGSPIASLKKHYTTALGFLMMLLLTVLGTQTTLAAKADGLAMRSVKFAAGNLIPIVGGSVAELLRTVSSGVGYLRGTIGLCGILLLLLMLLPTLAELFLIRMTWQLSASVADLFGCTSEKKLLDEFASLGGYLIAVISICSSVLLLAFTLLTHCASAIG